MDLSRQSLYPLLFTLSCQNNKWKARLFELAGKTNGVLPKEKILKNKNPEKLWSILKENHLLTLPDHETLNDADGNKAYPRVVDGIVYDFELISGTRHRSYSYGCPKAAANDFPYIKELAWAAAIIEEVVRYCKIRKFLKC